MKVSVIVLLLAFAIPSFAQKYKVGLVKEGAAIKNVTGEIVVAPAEVSVTIDSVKSALSVVSRAGFTIHVTDGTTPSKYVITHDKGRVHGFTYDCAIKHERDHHSKVPLVIYYCSVIRD